MSAEVPFGATVKFRENAADDYETGRIFGRSMKRGQGFYDMETETGRRFLNLTDVMEVGA